MNQQRRPGFPSFGDTFYICVSIRDCYKMGRIFDYFFKCDPFEFNFRLLTINGFWPIETKNKHIQVFYSIFSFLCCFSPISMLFIQLLDLYLLLDDPNTLTKNMCATSITIGCVVKYVLVFFKVDDVQALHKDLSEFQRSRTDPDDREIVKQSSRLMSQTMKSIYGLAVPCITAWMLYPGLESSDPKGVPFPYRLPTDDWSTPIYEILYTYQSMSMVGFMVGILSTDLIYYGMLIKLNAEYDMIIKKLGKIKNILKETSNTDGERFDGAVMQRVKLTLKECVVAHQKILKNIERLKSIYSMPYLVHFLSAMTLMGVIIIDIVLVSKGFKLQMLQRVMYTANGLFDTFLCCYFTTVSQEKSHDLMRAAYSVQWYKLEPKLRTDLMMIMMRSKKPPAIKVGNLFFLNLEAFLKFLKLSYNISAVLYQTVND